MSAAQDGRVKQRVVARLAGLGRLWCLLCVLPAGSAAAQGAPTPEYAVTGTVIDSDGNVVARAEVRVESKARVVLRITQSDSAGHFSAMRLGDAPAKVHVRAFGYAPREMSVSPSADTHRATVTIRLEPSAARLAGIGITETRADSDSKLASYRERKATNGFAHFVDGEDIARRRPQFVSEMLRSIGGVTLTASDKLGNILLIRGCAPLVWVDGVRMPGAQLDEVAPTEDVAGIEIYNSFAGIPARYFDRSATCGTILVWLRS
jgi:hypothetical protein